MSLSLRFGIFAIVLFALSVVLGRLVSRRPPMRIDAQAISFRGQAEPLAVFFTVSGRGPALTASCMLAIAIYSFLHLPLWIPLLVTITQMLSQIAVEVVKPLLGRIRPDYWIVGREAGHSYPSGHATTAVVFFGGWAILAASTALPGALKTLLVVLFSIWALGVMWSRLALGAHYLSDVCGGALFGGAWLCALLSISSHLYVILR